MLPIFTMMSSQASIFISEKGAVRAASKAVRQGRAHNWRVYPKSRIAYDRTRESGFVVAMYDTGKYVGHL